ncbi:heavy-metal-associated domain-containing protein [Caproiciproducens galactitolivorans]|uniref:Heavy-metal-associated domain protein n=1 Tax=Caproiciproducens galactitolivorans TaxID=642589 RepID=A0A4Z0YAY2_9FIRM|nr:heavy metal-associated domain-containing protein [Caproiciproducens galactitolivorans]QEY34888.1 heavy-metal-associated domain-containing protein [Caproiciproducens galactitolivorans]TGJ76411.1 heavy-metal-associated domain protein [Caproiciproducens galactitolivorans]
MNTVLCSVSGIQNKEGKTQIKNALNKLKGVQEVGVNLSTGTVKVDYNEPATELEIKNCIEHTGFKIEYE